MRSAKKDRSIQINFNLPKTLKEAITQIADELQSDYSDIYIQAFQEYVDRYNSRICQGCAHRNPPNSNFCNNCGLPMSREGLDEFNKVREAIIKNPRILLNNYERLSKEQ